MRAFFLQCWRQLWFMAALLLFLSLTSYQLGLPGLHYDEAKEAGVNAMELLTGAPVTAFRGATLRILRWELPLMVQDYIGALNVYLALPFLAATGIGVPNLRAVPIVTGLFGLIFLERAISEYWTLVVTRSGNRGSSPHRLMPKQSILRPRVTLPSLFALTLLAAAPSFIFWSRQGVFVTNLTQPLCFLCIWQGIRWLRIGRTRALLWSAFAGGLALYAKLLAGWVVGGFVLIAGGWWLWQRRQGNANIPALSPGNMLGAALAFTLGILPLLLFNLQTGGTLASVSANWSQSYYGVRHSDLVHNLPLRTAQLLSVLRGDHFWYLGGVNANGLAPWLAASAVGIGLWRCWRAVLPPLLIILLVIGMSLFTISDLFITHYALVHPLVIGTVGIAAAAGSKSGGHIRGDSRQRAAYIVTATAIGLWLVLDVVASLRYHDSLRRSGGLADHSDASYHLAYYLQYNGLGAPIALDWGIDATVRFLSRGTVNPVEIFGYDSPAEPDTDFGQRVRLFLPNSDNVYLLRAPGQAVFVGRREVFVAETERMGRRAILEQQFAQRNQQNLFELWRIVK